MYEYSYPLSSKKYHGLNKTTEEIINYAKKRGVKKTGNIYEGSQSGLDEFSKIHVI